MKLLNENFLNNKKNLKNIFNILLVILFVYIFFNYLFTFVAPFVIGFILSIIYKPIVNFLEKNLKLNRGLGTIISIVLLIMFMSFVVSGAINRIYLEASALKDNLPSYVENIHQGLLYLNGILDKALSFLPDSLQKNISFNNEKFYEIISSSVANITTSNGLSFVKGIPNFFVITLLSLLSSYFFAKEGKTISGFLIKVFPKHITEKYLILKKNLGSAVWGYTKAQIILMAFAFVICYIGFHIVKSPYSLILALVTSFIDALPFFGSGLILFPAIIMSLLSRNTFAALGYLLIYVAINIMRQILQPRVLSSQIGLTPLWTLFSLYLGLKILGVFGLILGPIIAVLIKAALEIPKKFEDDKVKNENSETKKEVITETITEKIVEKTYIEKDSEKTNND